MRQEGYYWVQFDLRMFSPSWDLQPAQIAYFVPDATYPEWHCIGDRTQPDGDYVIVVSERIELPCDIPL